MSKTATNNGEYSGNGSLQTDESPFEPVKFYAGAALTLLAPTLLCCAGMNQLWPLWVMASNEALGAILGFAMFKLQSGGVPSCVPLTRVRKAQHRAYASNLKKAA